MLALGLVLMVVSVGLLLAEAHLTTGGYIGAGAIVALVLGVTLALGSSGAALPVVILVAVGIAVAAGAALMLALRSLLPVARRRPRTGAQAMVGHVGQVRASNALPHVFVDGGLWRAQPSPLDGDQELRDGERVVVERVDGLTLCVRKAEDWELNPWS
jgi:membrane-bound ClpP family serine protease